MNKIDIVIPCFNESKCVELIYNDVGVKSIETP